LAIKNSLELRGYFGDIIKIYNLYVVEETKSDYAPKGVFKDFKNQKE